MHALPLLTSVECVRLFLLSVQKYAGGDNWRYKIVHDSVWCDFIWWENSSKPGENMQTQKHAEKTGSSLPGEPKDLIM